MSSGELEKSKFLTSVFPITITKHFELRDKFFKEKLK